MAGSTKGGFAAGAVLGAALGALVAWALTGGAPRGAAPAVVATAAPQVTKAPAPQPARAAEPGVAAKTPAHPGQHAALLSCRQALAAAEARAGEANSALHRASGKLAEAKAIQAQDEGTALKPPPGMPRRFMDPKFVRKQVQALFDGVGGGEITSVDCTEFPCVVYGQFVRDGPEAAKKTMMALSRAAMDPEGWGLCGFSQWWSPHAKKPTGRDAFGICPKGYFEGMTSAQKRRVGWRIHEMVKADLGL